MLKQGATNEKVAAVASTTTNTEPMPFAPAATAFATLNHHSDGDDYDDDEGKEDDDNGGGIVPSSKGMTRNSCKKSHKDITFLPGAVQVRYPDGDDNGDYDDDGLEGQVSKKIQQEDEMLHKYHQSVMPKDKPSSKTKRDWFFAWMALLTIVFVALLVVGFVTGIFFPSNDTAGSIVDPVPGNDIPSADRQAYYEELLGFFDSPLLEPFSPQEQAMEWLAFEDIPLTVPSNDDEDAVYDRIRLQQRYALATWYFAHGGPKLWTNYNRDKSAGWINHGIGKHECDWYGIDCEAMSEDQKDHRVVVALRLSTSAGVVLTGSTLSTELGMLTNIRRLDVSNQRLEGSIPDEWNTLTNLEMLLLSKNQIQTTIPEWIGESWTQLKTLTLNGNFVEGSLPSSFFRLSNLRHLELQVNDNLEGQFDEVMFAIPNLEHFDISSTAMAGTIPTEFAMPYLRVFQAWNTRGFTGTIPPEIGTWESLEILSLDDIQYLQGTLPTELGTLTNLEHLEIKRTPISGPLPTEIGNLTNLKMLVLSFLNLESTLPVEYSKMTQLEHMDLHINYGLTGTVPTEYGSLVNLDYFDIRTTNLSGEISSEVCAIDIEVMMAECPVKGDDNKLIICECCIWCGS